MERQALDRLTTRLARRKRGLGGVARDDAKSTEKPLGMVAT
jgi:hypothetical protein